MARQVPSADYAWGAANASRMEARDLRMGPPRRWNESVAGICWLPRLVDKARAALAGTLGGYLFGQSPMDSGLLRRLGLSHTDFARIVHRAPDDAAVLAAIHERDPEALARARAWSDAELPHRHKMFLWIMDFDDGYLGAPWTALKNVANAGSNAFTALVKRAMPSRAAEQAKGE